MARNKKRIKKVLKKLMKSAKECLMESKQWNPTAVLNDGEQLITYPIIPKSMTMIGAPAVPIDVFRNYYKLFAKGVVEQIAEDKVYEFLLLDLAYFLPGKLIDDHIEGNFPGTDEELKNYRIMRAVYASAIEQKCFHSKFRNETLDPWREANVINNVVMSVYGGSFFFDLWDKARFKLN